MESINVNEFYSRLKEVFNCFLERPNYWEIVNIDITKEEHLQPMSQILPDNTCNWIRI